MKLETAKKIHDNDLASVKDVIEKKLSNMEIKIVDVEEKVSKVDDKDNKVKNKLTKCTKNKKFEVNIQQNVEKKLVTLSLGKDYISLSPSSRTLATLLPGKCIRPKFMDCSRRQRLGVDL